MKSNKLEHRFVGSVPDEMENGVLYVSLDFATMMHLCACGCGREVVTPLSPKDWNFTYDGQSMSVSPSIGNWSLPCRSHYIIKKGAIQWAGDWSDEQIKRGRQNDLMRKRGQNASKQSQPPKPKTAPEQKSNSPSIFQKMLHWIKTRF